MQEIFIGPAIVKGKITFKRINGYRCQLPQKESSQSVHCFHPKAHELRDLAVAKAKEMKIFCDYHFDASSTKLRPVLRP
jgi:hypothetical protein